MQIPEVFISGTEPVGTCPLHGGRGDHTTVSGWDVPSTGGQANTSSLANILQRAPAPADSSRPRSGDGSESTRGACPKKKGFFGRLKDAFK